MSQCTQCADMVETIVVRRSACKRSISMTLPCLIVDETREPRYWPRAIPSLLLVLGLCTACSRANTVQKAVFREHGGPDWEDREWDEAMVRARGTAEAIEADFYDRWREHHPFAVGHLVVMRVEPEPGVLRGEPALGWVVSFMRGGRAEVKEGRHAGCVFEEQYSGCQEYVEQGQSGLALAHPVSEGRADYFHFFDHCVARAAELERETGTPARCMELSWFLREAEGGWRWEGGMEEGVLDLATVSEMMGAGGS